MMRRLEDGAGKEEEVVVVADCAEKLSIDEKLNACGNI